MNRLEFRKLKSVKEEQTPTGGTKRTEEWGIYFTDWIRFIWPVLLPLFLFMMFALFMSLR